MSSHSSFVYGYGFGGVDLIEDEVLKRFIVSHKSAFCHSDKEKQLFAEIEADLEDELPIGDLFERYCCDVSGLEGIGAVVSNIMSRETGIRFEYECGDADCDSYPSVLLAECMPWMMNETEKALTEDTLFEICKQYMNELGLNNDYPDGLGIEYYG